jgi:hypothetical protein
MTGYAFTHMGVGSQAILVISALFMIAPNVQMTLVGVAIALPALVLNWLAAKRVAPS